MKDILGGWAILCLAATLGVSQVHATLSGGKSAAEPVQADPRCSVNQRGKGQVQAVCEGLSSLQELATHLPTEQLSSITTLTINSSNSSLNLDDLIGLPTLRELKFKHSYILDWKTPKLDSYPRVTLLELEHCWDNSTFHIKGKEFTLTLASEMLSSVPSLEELHITGCYLINLGRLDDMKQLQRLNIVDSGLRCDENNLWLLDWVDAGWAAISNTTTCFVPSFSLNVMETVSSFNDQPFWMCMNYIKNTKRDCMPPCKCEVTGIKDTLPIIHVKCQAAGLTQFPQIPLYTKRLDLTRNNISDMNILFTHKNYRHIDLIFLDHNRISHMNGRLFCEYVKNRSLDLGISLSHNALSTMPVKEMKRLYNEAVQEGKLYLPLFELGNNPWNCDDCEFLPEFQSLLYYQNIKVNSLIDIRCADWSTHHSGQQIITLDVQSHCAPKPPLLQPIDILNICMGILLLLIILNFFHNFLQYRRHGNLPWIITNLPCC